MQEPAGEKMRAARQKPEMRPVVRELAPGQRLAIKATRIARRSSACSGVSGFGESAKRPTSAWLTKFARAGVARTEPDFVVELFEISRSGGVDFGEGGSRGVVGSRPGAQRVFEASVLARHPVGQPPQSRFGVAVAGVAVGRTPAASLLQPFLQGAHFADAYEIELDDPGETPSEVFARAILATPAWVSLALSARDRLVRVLGLKTVGPMRGEAESPPAQPKVGNRFGIFTVIAANRDELLLGIDDKHLHVRVSIAKHHVLSRARIVVSTAVRNHNWLGRLYMLPVARIHPQVVKAMLRRL
jgi:hypothetical protein